jgi:hypothetical protein
MAAILRSLAKALPEKVVGGLPLSYQTSNNLPDQAEEFGTQTRDPISRSGAFYNASSSDTLTVEDKIEDISTPPIWPFLCVREIENAKRERIKRMGVIPAFDADMKALADQYGTMAADDKAFLASLGDDSSDDERCRQICARREIGNWQWFSVMTMV